MIEKLAAYLLAILFAVAYLKHGHEKTCPTPLIDPRLFIVGLATALLIGPQYIESLPALLSLYKSKRKEAIETTLVILAILIDSRNFEPVITFILFFTTIRWYCLAGRYFRFMPPAILAAVWPPNLLLYVISYAASKKMKPKPMHVIVITIVIVTLLLRFGFPAGSAAASILIASSGHIQNHTQTERTTSPRNIMQ